MSDYSKMTKEELINIIKGLEEQIAKMKNSKDLGRKGEVLAMLQTGRFTIAELSAALNISDKNVSSQLSYLRKDGWLIGTDSKKRKFIEEPEVDEKAEEKSEA